MKNNPFISKENMKLRKILSVEESKNGDRVIIELKDPLGRSQKISMLPYDTRRLYLKLWEMIFDKNFLTKQDNLV